MDKGFMESRGYTFQGSLGEGTFGKVVKAHSTHIRKLVAIKIVNTKKLSSVYKEKFLSREMRILRSLNHPNIVRTHNIFESRTGTVYVVMELYANGDLSKYILVRGSLDESSSCRFFKQLCQAIQYLHNMEVAHRDLKCENLLLDIHSNIKVCDFGLSKTLTYVDGQMVLSETYCGTSPYAAPELLRCTPYNPKVSDVWSMGVVLHMMLYGSVPFKSSNISRLIKAQMAHCINFPDTSPVSSEAKELIRGILHPVVQQRMSIDNILESSWMLPEGKMESDSDSGEASTSKADPGQKGPPAAPDEKDE